MAAVLAACVLVFVVLPRAIAPDQPFDTGSVASVGAAVSVIAGALGAGLWILARRGLPFGPRDLRLDRTSPYLRKSRRYRSLLGMATLGAGLGGCAFAVSWYPNGHLDPQHYQETPEQYALGILVGAWLMIALGTALLILNGFWALKLRSRKAAA
jgi:hypothetical protein